MTAKATNSQTLSTLEEIITPGVAEEILNGNRRNRAIAEINRIANASQ